MLHGEPLPDIEALLQDLSARLDACSGDEELQLRIESMRERITGMRVRIMSDLQYLERDCARLQAKIDVRAIKQLSGADGGSN